MAQEITEDRLFQGALMLRQPAKGHRAGTDGVLLAAATPPDAGAIADLGASTGLVGLRALQMNPHARGLLVERDPALCALARANVEGNVLSARAEIVETDLARAVGLKPWRESCDLVLTNPPYFNPNRGRTPPEKAAAHVMQGLSLDLWVQRAASLLAPRGRFAMIHRADHVAEVLSACARRFGSLRLVFIHPRLDAPAIRLVISGIKGSRGPLEIRSPLVLHQDDGGFTEEAAALHAGSARLDRLW
jgi:tRNA1(Val) A37 N6-methylase TrmN6